MKEVILAPRLKRLRNDLPTGGLSFFLFVSDLFSSAHTSSEGFRVKGSGLKVVDLGLKGLGLAAGE